MPFVLCSAKSSVIVVFFLLFGESFDVRWAIIIFPLPISPIAGGVPSFLFVVFSVFSVTNFRGPGSSFSFVESYLFGVLEAVFSPCVINVISSLVSAVVSSVFFSVLPS